MPRKPSKLMPGDVLAAKYEIVRVIGQGGMGIVYEAFHRRLQRKVAIKMILVDRIDAELLERFEREARVGALLESKHIAAVYDIDTTSDGTVYLVMELLKGRSLADVAELENVSVEDLFRWTAEVCGVLEKAHASGVIHRDLKPENVFIVQAEPRYAKVLDFGVAKLLHAEELTERGAIAGTPAFMAPEQLRGLQIDSRADQFSVGAMLYNCLTGRLPFDEKHPKGYMLSVLTDAPVPLHEVRTDIPLPMSSVVMRALEKARDDRYATISDLRVALEEAILQIRSASGWMEIANTIRTPSVRDHVEEKPHHVEEKPRDLPKNGDRRGLVAVLGSVVVAVIVGAGAALWLGKPSSVAQPNEPPEAPAAVRSVTRPSATTPTSTPSATSATSTPSATSALHARGTPSAIPHVVAPVTSSPVHVARPEPDTTALPVVPPTPSATSTAPAPDRVRVPIAL